MTTSTRLALALAAGLLAAPAFAATPINQTRPLAADGSVSISNVAGRITVRTWDQPQVKITGSLGAGVEKLLIEGDERSLRIEVKYPEGHKNWFGWGKGRSGSIEDTILEVTLPKKASVEAEAVSANVDVQGVLGRRLEVSSVSGDVDVSRSAPGEASFANVSGDLELWLDTTDLEIDNVSGDIYAHGALTGDVEMNSVSGELRLVARQLRRLDVTTVSGDSDLRLSLANGAHLDAESVSGSIVVRLPTSTSAHLSLESFSGDIESPVGHVEEEEHGPGSSLDARMGSGNADVNIETLSGDIQIITADAPRPASKDGAPDVE